MNKKHGLLFGFAVIALAAIFTFTGCPAEDDGGGGGDDGVKGKLTITNLPAEANGSYVIVAFGSSSIKNIFSLAEKPTSTDNGAKVLKAVKITGTSVTIPLWKLEPGSWVAYDKSETKAGTAYIGIPEKTSQDDLLTWSAAVPIGDVTFTNGNATVSVGD
jgi:hypothetical protein